jgi:hypothetical protein
MIRVKRRFCLGLPRYLDKKRTSAQKVRGSECENDARSPLNLKMISINTFIFFIIMRSKQSMMDISYGSFHISALDKKRKK